MFDLIYHPAPLYGLLTVAALALTALSGRHVLIKLALVLLFDWIAYNVIVDSNGFARAPLLIPTFDAAVGIWVGTQAWINHSRVGAIVFALFTAVVAWWCAEIWAHAQASYLCYLMANLIFLSQVSLVGGAGGFAYVVDRRRSGHMRAHPHLARG